MTKIETRECVYTMVTRNDVIYIVTTVIGLIGGLATTLKMITRVLVKIVRRSRVPSNSVSGESTAFVFRLRIETSKVPSIRDKNGTLPR